MSLVHSAENTASEYLDLPLGEFLERVASEEPAPGGGSVSAVAVALAAGLAGMAARLSTGQMDEAPELAGRADASRRRVAPLAKADAESYGRVLDALRSQGDPETREERIRDALSGAAEVPLAVAEIGSGVADIAARLVEEGRTNSSAGNCSTGGGNALGHAGRRDRVSVRAGRCDAGSPMSGSSNSAS